MELNKILRETAIISSVRSGELQMQTDSGFRFTIPIVELQGAEVHFKDKAIRYLKWIRPQFEVMVNNRIEDAMGSH